MFGRVIPFLLLLASTPAHAFTIVDHKPDKGFDSISADFGGFIQPRFSIIPADEEHGSAGTLGFGIRRMRLETSGKFVRALGEVGGERVDFTLQPRLSVEFTPEPNLRDAHIEIGLGAPLQFRLGQFKAPVSRSIVNSDRGAMLPDRAFWVSELGERHVGLQVGGSLGKKHVEYAFGLWNGEGPNQPVNVNRKFLWAGRVVVSPLGGPGTGEEVLRHDGDPWKRDPEAQKWIPTFSLGYAIHHNVLGPEGAEEASIGHDIEAFLHWRWVTLQFEWLWRTTDFEDPSIPDYRTQGFYLQAASFIPAAPWLQDHVAVLFRLEQGDTRIPVTLDLPLTGASDPAQAQRRISFGGAFYANKPLFKNVGDLRVTVTYSVRQELEGLSYDNDELLVSAHLGF